MAFIVNEWGVEDEYGPMISDPVCLSVFGPFDTEEDAIKWAKSEAKRRWESPVGEASKIVEAAEVLAGGGPGRLARKVASLPLHAIYEDLDDLYADCYFSITELTNPNAGEV